MKKYGFWKKYEESSANYDSEFSSYKKLHNDLKDSNKGWNIEDSLHTCAIEICGEKFPYAGIRGGDIYVYYEIDEDGHEIAQMYIKVCKENEQICSK